MKTGAWYTERQTVHFPTQETRGERVRSDRENCGDFMKVEPLQKLVCIIGPLCSEAPSHMASLHREWGLGLGGCVCVSVMMVSLVWHKTNNCENSSTVTKCFRIFKTYQGLIYLGRISSLWQYSAADQALSICYKVLYYLQGLVYRLWHSDAATDDLRQIWPKWDTFVKLNLQTTGYI